MTEQLIQAIKKGRKWVDGFTRYSYSETFGQYRECYQELYRVALSGCESTEALARDFIAAVEESWKKEKFWNRSAAKVDDKVVLTCYLTPMLLDAGTECAQFADALCRAWNDKWPNNTYETADYETIANGFRHSIMGIDMENKHLDKTRDN